MSRGLGNVQNNILDEIKNFGGEVQQNQLLWYLADKQKQISQSRHVYDDIYEGAIHNSYKNSFLRAIDELIKSDKIRQEDKIINELKDLFRYYTFKTYDLEIFSLRKKLLPVLIKFLEDGYHFTSQTETRFGTTDHEIFILKNKMDDNPDFRKKVSTKWINFESEILETITDENTLELDKWMRLLIKGRQLFLTESSLKYGLSFQSILKKLLSTKNDLSKTECMLLEKIEKFKSGIFSEGDINRAILKTTLYKVVNFKKGGTTSLHKEVKGFMLNQCQELILALPGHEKPPKVFRNASNYEFTKFSNVLDRLIDRRIFSSFHFLSIK